MPRWRKGASSRRAPWSHLGPSLGLDKCVVSVISVQDYLFVRVCMRVFCVHDRDMYVCFIICELYVGACQSSTIAVHWLRRGNMGQARLLDGGRRADGGVVGTDGEQSKKGMCIKPLNVSHEL